jgi:prepilin-type N-terminal cleavage/methylation domain-containing protein
VGFTLIELLVVISVLGVIGSVIMIATNGVREKARDANRLATFKQITTAMEMYMAEYGYYPQYYSSANTADNWNNAISDLRAAGFLAQADQNEVNRLVDNNSWLNFLPVAHAQTNLLQDPKYPDMVYQYKAGVNAQTYRIRVLLENTSHASLSSSLKGPFLYDYLLMGVNSCDVTLGYYCTGSSNYVLPATE